MGKELAKRDDFDFDIDFSDMMIMVVMMVMMVSVLGSVVAPLSSMAQQLQAQAFLGLTDSRTLNSKATMQWINLISSPPYTPWVTASFHNHGPYSTFIGVNNPGELTEIPMDGKIDVDMSGGDRRIELVFYKCNAGERASVTVVAKY